MTGASVKPTVEPQFKKEDVWAVARAVAAPGEWYTTDDQGRYSWHECRYCGNVSNGFIDQRPDSIQHAPTCAYLIAIDLLTGAP